MNVDSIFSTIKRLNNEIASLRTKLATKRKDEANARDKAMKAISAAQSTRSESTQKSKLTEYERETKKSVSLAKEIADLEKRLSEKENTLLKEQEKLHKAQEEAAAKRLKQDELRMKQTSRQLQSLSSSVRNVQTEQAKINQAFPLLSVRFDESYDVFISHASEDKEPFVDSLVEELLKRGVKVWYDRKELTWGRSIRQNIDLGLRQSKFAIIVLSEFYIKKYWTQKEFNALFSLGSQQGEFLLPIWHNITPERAKEFSPMLSDAIALKSSDYTVEEFADMFVEKLNYENNG